MESVEAEVRTRYFFHARVREVKEQHEREYLRGYDKSTEFKYVSRGWFAWLEGSHELLYLGNEKPNMDKGDIVKVTIEKVEDAKSSRPSEQ